MKITQTLFSYVLLLSALLGLSSLASAQVTRTTAPRVFLIDGRRLAETKRRIQLGDQTFAAALARLESDARRAMQQKPSSVVTKPLRRPSGDKHDYLSQAPYFWPNPSKPDGLPYIRRDGERNPEINKITDHLALDQMESAVRTLALGYYFKQQTKSTQRKQQICCAPGFSDPTTRMNPNLEYAQFIPGVNTGRGIGLIETRGLVNVVDAVGLLAGSKSWTVADQKGLETWFGKFLQWMQQSKNGREEKCGKEQSWNVLRRANYFVCVVCRQQRFGKTDRGNRQGKTHRRANRTRWSPTVGVGTN